MVASIKLAATWDGSPSLNPLHCGAVVASRRCRRLLRRCGARLNPLHCGAVVATPKGAGRDIRRGGVSIPFIAGQWSLPPPPPGGGGDRRLSQSPSLRGSGRFGTPPDPIWRPLSVSIPFIAGQWSLRETRRCLSSDSATSQSPSLRGSGRFRRTRPCTASGCRVSIPFIAGQWSLPLPHGQDQDQKVGFQSPSLRGSGRFHLPPSLRVASAGEFQSPSLRGSGRFPESCAIHPPRPASLNPLHCGAVVASAPTIGSMRARGGVSIPFIAGQWSLPFDKVDYS